MADRKGKSSRRKRTRRSAAFAQFKGKIIDRVEAHTTDYGCAIGIMFDDLVAAFFTLLVIALWRMSV